MNEAVLNLIVKVKDQATKELGKVGGALDTASDRLDKVGATANRVGKTMTVGLTLPVVGAAVASVKAFTDLGEAVNATQVVYGAASSELIKFAETAATTAGLSKRAVLQAATPIGSMLQNMGLSAQVAAQQSINLTQRAADMASVFNTDVNDALGAIQAGLRGEADPLERFGVGLSETAVKAYAMRNGIGKANGEMTAQEKAMARLGLFFEQTNKVQGDFVNTSDSLANKQRIAKAEMENAAATLGEKLAPAATFVMDKVAGLIDGFNSLSPGMQNAIIIVGGIVAALGPLVTVLGWVATAVGGVSAALAFLAANPVVLVIIGIVAVIAGLAFLIIKNWETIKTFFAGLFNWLAGAARVVVDAVTGYFSFMGNAIRNNIGTIVGLVTGLPGRILGAIGNFGGLLYSKGQDLINGLLNGAGSILGKIGSFFLDKVPGFIREPFKKALGISSPSKVFAGYGQNIVEGLAQGIEANAGQAVSAIQTAASNVSGAFVTSTAAPGFTAGVATGGGFAGSQGNGGTNIEHHYHAPINLMNADAVKEFFAQAQLDQELGLRGIAPRFNVGAV